MADKVKVIGGPLDGVGHGPQLGVRRAYRFAWINRAGTVSAGPAPGRELYALEVIRATRGQGTEEVYVFAGDAYTRCGCGGYTRKAEGGRESVPCPLCGERTIGRAA